MIDLDFNDYFIKNDNCYDLRKDIIILDLKLDPTLIVIITFSLKELTKFGTICLKVL